MNKIVIGVLTIAMLIGSSGVLARTAEASVHVKGYVKKTTHTYVLPHHRTSPNHTVLDNWGTKGNYNPYTGKTGTKSIFKFK